MVTITYVLLLYIDFKVCKSLFACTNYKNVVKFEVEYGLKW